MVRGKDLVQTTKFFFLGQLRNGLVRGEGSRDQAASGIFKRKLAEGKGGSRFK